MLKVNPSILRVGIKVEIYKVVSYCLGDKFKMLKWVQMQ